MKVPEAAVNVGVVPPPPEPVPGPAPADQLAQEDPQVAPPMAMDPPNAATAARAVFISCLFWVSAPAQALI